MKNIFHKHSSLIDRAHDIIAEILPHHRLTWRDHLYHFRLHLAIFLLLVASLGFVLWPGAGEPLETADPVSDINTAIATSGSLRGAGLAESLSLMRVSDPLAVSFPQMIHYGLNLAGRSPLRWLSSAALLGIDLGREIASYSFANTSQALVLGTDLGQDLAGYTLIFQDRAAHFTQLLASLRATLKSRTFFLADKIPDPPSELESNRSYLQEQQKKLFAAIDEARQIELHIKSRYQDQKAVRETLGRELTALLDSGQAGSVSEASEKYQRASSLLASIEAEFKLFQKLEQDLRALSRGFKDRLDYIDDHYEDLALGLCDWLTCK